MGWHALAAKHAPPLRGRGALRRPHIQAYAAMADSGTTQQSAHTPFFALNTSRCLTHDPLPPGGLIYVSGGDLKHRNGSDVYYKFRPSSHFVYLTGVPEPGFACLLDPASARFTLVAPKPHEDAEL